MCRRLQFKGKYVPQLTPKFGLSVKINSGIGIRQ